MNDEDPKDRPPQIHLSTAIVWMLLASLLVGFVVLHPAHAIALLVSFVFATVLLIFWYKLMRLKINNGITATLLGIAAFPLLVMGLIALILFIKALLASVLGERFDR